MSVLYTFCFHQIFGSGKKISVPHVIINFFLFDYVFFSYVPLMMRETASGVALWPLVLCLMYRERLPNPPSKAKSIQQASESAGVSMWNDGSESNSAFRLHISADVCQHYSHASLFHKECEHCECLCVEINVSRRLV